MRVGEEIGETCLEMRNSFGVGEILAWRHEFHPLAFIAEHNVLCHVRRQLRGEEPGEVVVTLIPAGPDYILL